MNRLAGWLRLVRPLNVVLAGFAVGVGASVPGRGIPIVPALGWAALAAALITAGGNALNDAVDAGVDRVNKPRRPVASGRISPRAATVVAALLLAGGAAAALPLPGICLLIAVLAAVFSALYDVWGKGRPLAGNVMVALIAGFAFPFGSLAVGRGWWGWIPAVLAFLFHLAREIVKDLEDLEADRSGGLNTLPIFAGERAARRTAQAVLVGLLLFFPVPVAAGWLGRGYAAIAGIGVGLPALLLIVGLGSVREEADYRRFQRLLKWDMIVGLLAVLAG